MKTDRQPEKLITVREAAAVLGLKECTVRLWLDRGVLRKIKLGKKAVRVPIVDVIRLIDEGTVRTPGMRPDEPNPPLSTGPAAVREVPGARLGSTDAGSQ